MDWEQAKENFAPTRRGRRAEALQENTTDVSSARCKEIDEQRVYVPHLTFFGHAKALQFHVITSQAF